MMQIATISTRRRRRPFMAVTVDRV